jgi:hypothetical protein
MQRIDWTAKGNQPYQVRTIRFRVISRVDHGDRQPTMYLFICLLVMGEIGCVVQ